MGKAKSFAAKTAHSQTGEGKITCPVCAAEVKKIKLITSRKSNAGTWAPKYDIRNICKCNEQDILNGKV